MNRRREIGRLALFVALTLLISTRCELRAADFLQLTQPNIVTADGIEMGLNLLPSSSPHADRIVFSSYSATFVADDTNNVPDIFLWTRSTSSLLLISIATNGPANGASFDPALSRDGNCVAFVSTASNLLPTPDTNKVDDVFLANLATGEMELISVPLQTTGARISGTRFTAISEDGRFVAYATTRTDLTPTLTSSRNDHVLVRDRQTSQTLWVNSDPTASAVPARPIAIRQSGAWFFAGTNVFRFDLTNQSLRKFGVSTVEPSFTTDGSKIALQVATSRTNVVSWYDVATGDTNVVFTGPTNRVLRYDGLSIADNGAVAFMATASDDTNRLSDIYAALPGGDPASPVWISSMATPADATVAASSPILSPDASRVYFKLTTVSKIDFSRRVEIYIRDLAAAAPQLVAAGSYFSKMIRTPSGPLVVGGSGDFAFTTPSNESDLALLPYPPSNPSTIPLKLGAVSNGWKLSFDKIPNVTPTVQFTDGLNPAAWTDLGLSLEDGGTEWILNDPATATQRFYRLHVAP
jgi:hypothetical protein